MVGFMQMLLWERRQGQPFTARGLGIQQGQHIYTEDLIEFSGGAHAEGTVQWHVTPLPFYLQNHPDKLFSQYIYCRIVSKARISVGMSEAGASEVVCS